MTSSTAPIVIVSGFLFMGLFLRRWNSDPEKALAVFFLQIELKHVVDISAENDVFGPGCRRAGEGLEISALRINGRRGFESRNLVREQCRARHRGELQLNAIGLSGV